jgi:hypothetical protein
MTKHTSEAPTEAVWTAADLEYVKPGDLVDDTKRERFFADVKSVGRGLTAAQVVGWIAFEDATEKPKARDYADLIGVSPDRVSRLRTYAAAYRRGIKPHGRTAAVWTLMVTSNATGVRAVADDKKSTKADVIAAIREAHAKQHGDGNPETGTRGHGDDGESDDTRSAQVTEAFGIVLRDLKSVAERIAKAGPPKHGEVASAQNAVADIVAVLSDLAVGLDAEIRATA